MVAAMMDPGSSPPNALADLIERERGRIIARWKDRVLHTEAKAKGVSEPALQDSIPDLIREIVAALRREAPQTLDQQAPEAAGVAREHGRQRYHIGFDLRVVVLEYDFLREVLFEVFDESGLPLCLADLRVVSTALSIGIAEAVDQYSIERENDLRARAAERERASEFERQLIGIVSHDLRSPLASILMAVELATRSGRFDEPTARQLGRIRLAAERATRLIADLLDFTRERNASRIPVKPQQVELRALVHAAIEEALGMFPGRIIRYHSEEPVEGHWDPDRITQVLSNLLTNAVKFSPPPTPVSIRTHADEDSVLLEVHNEGPPIPTSRMATLFEPFQRGDPATRTGSSLGLGLYISRQIVLAHGGAIDVRSSEEAGTTFVVHLPLRAPEARS